MDQTKEHIAAILTEILFSKLSSRFFGKYTDYEMQTGFLKTEIMKVYYAFLEEINNPPDKKKK
jgi:hypothetical protein